MGEFDASLTATERAWFDGGAMNEATLGTDNMPLGAKPANPKQAFGDLKVPLQLVPAALKVAAATGLKEGIVKGYGAWNWRTTNVEAMTYIGAIERHLEAWKDGEEIDPESVIGKHHLDGLAASLAILLDALKGGFLIDNRPPKGPAPGLVRTPGVTK
jgi:hypothetical protein